MKPDMFKESVSILVGLGFPAEARSVMDAYPRDWTDAARQAEICGLVHEVPA